MFQPGFGAFIAFSLLGPVLLLGIIVLAVTVVAGGKEPDPTGLRVRAVYLATTCFVALFIMVGSVFAVVTSITDLIGENDSSSFIDEDSGRFGSGDFDENRTENAVSGAVLATFIGLAGAAVFQFHQKRMEELIASPGFADMPSKRPIQAYHYTVAFASAFTALAAAVAAAYALYRIAVPDYSAPDAANERTGGARQLVASAALLAMTGFLFVRHFERPRLWEDGGVTDTLPPPPPPEIDLSP